MPVLEPHLLPNLAALEQQKVESHEFATRMTSAGREDHFPGMARQTGSNSSRSKVKAVTAHSAKADCADDARVQLASASYEIVHRDLQALAGDATRWGYPERSHRMRTAPRQEQQTSQLRDGCAPLHLRLPWPPRTGAPVQAAQLAL